MAVIITTLKKAIEEFRKLYLANSISPETVGYLLNQIVAKLEEYEIDKLTEVVTKLNDSVFTLNQSYKANGDTKFIKELYFGYETNSSLKFIIEYKRQLDIAESRNLIESLDVPVVNDSQAGIMTAEMYNVLQGSNSRNIFPACPMLQQEHLLYMKPGLTGSDKIRSSQIDGLGDGTEVIVFELDGSQTNTTGVGISLIFRDTSIVRYKSQISGNDTYDWEFDCVVRQNGQLYTAKVTVITARSAVNVGYEVRSVRIRKF